MAAISNQVSRYPFAALRKAAPAAGGRYILWWRDILSNAFRQAQEILWALWMCAVLAFSLLLAAGFVA